MQRLVIHEVSGKDVRAGRLDSAASATRRAPARRRHAVGLLALVLLAGSGTAFAADGCLVLLCLAAPSWSSIGQCVDPVRQVFRDLARGRPFPSCDAAGGGNHARNNWSSPPAFCPVQYTRSIIDGGTFYTCDYDAAIEVDVNGAPWTRTWWRFSGEDTVTEFTPAAKARLGNWDTRFDDDYARWLASAPQPCTTC